jgi:methyl-accepting chemotaxis protein
MAASAAGPRTGRHQRRLRNYLLDRRFQLKYAGYFVGIALVLSLALGLILWRTSQELLRQSEQVVERGQAVVKEGRKVSDVVRMNIVQDPVYGDDPALKAAFEEGDKKYAEQLINEQHQLEQQSLALARQHTAAAWVLIGALLLFVVFVGLAGIVVTHKVAGPVFKMKRQILEVADGHLQLPGRLRRGDELVEFFAAFDRMVRRLRDRQESEIALLEDAIATLEKKAASEDLELLRQLRDEMRAALDA